MAPEQWEGRKQDARTDQYALAVTAYELLSGHVPFSGTDTEVLKDCVLHTLPSPIPDMPDYVNTALFKGLAKNRNDRFENCRSFVEALAKESEPPRLPPPLPSTLPKSSHWEWYAMAVIAVIVIVSIAGLFLNRQSPKPTVDADLNIKSVAETDHIAGNAPQIDFEKEVKSCTISCWGVKDENGRLRINATYSHPFMEKDRTLSDSFAGQRRSLPGLQHDLGKRRGIIRPT